MKAYTPFPKACDREAYGKLPEELKKKIVAEGEEYLHFSFPVIRISDFMHFKRTGNRVDFEDKYFTRRRALNILILAECVEGTGRFLDDIINGIFVLCEESAWQLPAHNSYLRGESQYILPDSTRPVLDLFACETGALLACTSYLLGDTLDKISPFITKRIACELNTRIIRPYLTQHFWWMGNGDEKMCNWTVWCTQNVLLTAFLAPASALSAPIKKLAENTSSQPDAANIIPVNENASDELSLCCNSEIYQAVIEKAAKSCDYFLKDYGEDGCCDEGAQYYRHAGLCLFNALDILNQVTEGAFAHFFLQDKIKNIAAYILNVHVADKYYFNFSDCSPVAGRAGVREYLFGKRTGQPALMQFAAKDFLASGCQLYNDEGINLFYRLQTVFAYEEVVTFAQTFAYKNTNTGVGACAADYPYASVSTTRDIFYPSVGLFVARSSTLSLAVKAGCNGDSHNHNDTGSFTLYKNGKPVFADIGVESYTEKTFSSRRYEIWTMQSCYHNLPTINGLDQKDGRDFCASDVETGFTEDSAFITMELAGAYPFEALQAKQISYKRSVSLDKRNNLIRFTDETNAENAVLNLITYEKPFVADKEIQLGNLALISFTGADFLKTEVLPITDARLQKAWNHELYRIQLILTDIAFRMEVK